MDPESGIAAIAACNLSGTADVNFTLVSKLLLWDGCFFEVLSKKRSIANADWLKAPMQGSPKRRSACANGDWLRATAGYFRSDES